VADATPCTPENCGEAFSRCGTVNGYKYWKCRCEACKTAKSGHARKYRASHRETIRKQQKAWVEANREHVQDYHRNYRAERRPELLQRQLEYRKARRVELAAKQREYNANNREAIAEYMRTRYTGDGKFAESARQRVRQWVLDNPERARMNTRLAASRRRARIRNATVVPFTQEQLDQRMAYYGNRCYIKTSACTGGFDDIDHVKPISSGGAHMLSNLRPACEPCNSRKHARWPFNPEDYR